MSLSIIIPAYNEETIFTSVLPAFLKTVGKAYKNCEVIVVENGSTDQTYKKAKALSRSYALLKVYQLPAASFGGAVKKGILEAKNQHIVLLNADWLDLDFIADSLPLLEEHDVVIGSKVLNAQEDHRQWYRKLASQALTAVLRLWFGFKFSDSHGLKAFRAEQAQNVIADCTMNEIIESEFLLLADIRNLKITEIPVAITESRSPRISFTKRIFSVGKELIALQKARRRALSYAHARR